MRRLMDVCSEVTGRFQTALTGTFFRRAGVLAAAGAVCVSSQAFAQDKARPEHKQDSEVKIAHATNAAEVMIPECIEKLKLTEEQQTKAKGIIGTYDQKIDAVWKQFGVKYMATVRTECMLLAAIEDGLTETQRTAIHAERRQVAHAEMASEGTNRKTNQSTEKPADAVEQAVAGAGITLTPEQETAAEKIQQNYASHLRSLNRDIEGLHNRLVSLEADKLVEIEKVLTKAQLTQLQDSRKTTTGVPAITAVVK